MKNRFEDILESIPTIISQSSPGWYRLSDLLKPTWGDVGVKTSLGRLFKSLVEDGAFSDICIGDKTVKNHQLYWIG